MFELNKDKEPEGEGFTIEKKEETKVKSKKKLIGSIVAGAGIGAGILYAVLKKGSVEECDLVDSGSDDDGPEDEEFPDPEGE